MKRDLDFIRAILLKIEDSDTDVYPNSLVDDAHSIVDVNHHLKLLLDVNYIEAMDATTLAGECYIVRRITMSGYDYLDNIRSDTIWRKVKDKLTKITGGTATAALDVVKTVAATIITQSLC